MGCVVVVEVDVKTREGLFMRLPVILDELLRFYPLVAGAQHDWRAVRIAGADIDAIVTDEFLETHPDVGLQILHEMADMNRSVCIRQCAGNQNLSSCCVHSYHRPGGRAALHGSAAGAIPDRG